LRVRGATIVLARTASGDVQPSASLAACVAAAIRSGAGVIFSACFESAVFASVGRFGPYIGSDGEFRSLKAAVGDPYTVTLDEALSVLAAPKLPPRGVTIVKEIGKHPKTGKSMSLYKSKQGLFLKKGLRRIYLPETVKIETLTPSEASEYLK
jgi:topoisomerase IA-like protein